MIDTAKEALIRNIAVGPNAVSVAITPDGKKVYVADASTDSLSVIDTQRNLVTKTIITGFGNRPVDVAVATDGASAYVSSSHDVVSVIDTASDTVATVMRGKSVPSSVTMLRRCSPGIVSSSDGRIVYAVSPKWNMSSIGVLPPTTDLAFVDDRIAMR